MDARDRTVAATSAGMGAAAATTAALSVTWSAIWIGAFSSVVAAVLFGFIGTAIGAHKAGYEGRVTDTTLGGAGLGGLAFAVLAAFFAYVIGAWIAVRIAGVRAPETAALYGAVVFVVATVVLLALASQAAQYLNGWYAGLAPAPVAQPAPAGQPIDPTVAKAARNSAAAAAAAMLIGLIGAVIGGWFGSGEPMWIARKTTAGAARRVADRPY